MNPTWGLLIPIIAILAVFAIPILGIINDAKRRRMLFEERRLMIEKGMEPPPYEEPPQFAWGHHRRHLADPVANREACLQRGTVLLFLGLGLAVPYFLLPAGLAFGDAELDKLLPMMVIGSAVLTALGLGNLVYFALAKGRTLPENGGSSGAR